MSAILKLFKKTDRTKIDSQSSLTSLLVLPEDLLKEVFSYVPFGNKNWISILLTCKQFKTLSLPIFHRLYTKLATTIIIPGIYFLFYRFLGFFWRIISHRFNITSVDEYNRTDLYFFNIKKREFCIRKNTELTTYRTSCALYGEDCYFIGGYVNRHRKFLIFFCYSVKNNQIIHWRGK